MFNIHAVFLKRYLTGYMDYFDHATIWRIKNEFICGIFFVFLSFVKTDFQNEFDCCQNIHTPINFWSRYTSVFIKCKLWSTSQSTRSLYSHKLVSYWIDDLLYGTKKIRFDSAYVLASKQKHNLYISSGPLFQKNLNCFSFWAVSVFVKILASLIFIKLIFFVTVIYLNN